MKSLAFIIRPGQGLTIQGKNLTVTGDALPRAAGNEIGDFDRIFVEARPGQLVRPLRNPQPFDLEKAKAGAELITRNGRKARFLAHVPEALECRRVLAFVEGESAATSFYDDGRYGAVAASALDLFLAPEPVCNINGHEFPEPVREPLEIGQMYWVASTGVSSNIESCEWMDDGIDRRLLKAGLIHLSHEAAAQHVRAIILASGGTCE